MGKKRKGGDGSVRLRKDGRWEGRYVVGYDDKGYPKTKNVLAKTKRECVEKLDALKTQYAAPKTEKLSADMAFGDWLDYWYQNYVKDTIRPSTQQGYENSIYRHIIPALGAIPLNKLSQSDLQQFYMRLKQNGRLLRPKTEGKALSDRSVRLCHVNCRTALQKAVEQGLIRANPADGCKLPPKRSKEMQVLTREEMQRFLIQAKEEGYYEIFLLELATGLRRGELLALQWSDVNLDTGELHVSKQINRVNGKLTVSEPKTKASIRTIILPQSVVAVLSKYKRQVYSRWLFPSPVNSDIPRDPSSVRKILQRVLEHAGCKQVRFHDLRHTFITTSLEHGMDVKTLSAIVGHVSASITLDVYSHITDAMQREAAANIDRGIGKNDSARGNEKPQTPSAADFQAQKGKRRRPGTGCVTQIDEHLWEGRYTPTYPDGKRHPRNVYAHSEEECEAKLERLIAEMRAEIATLKAKARWQTA